MPSCEALVVEDDYATQLLLHTLCRRLGLHTESAGDGLQAIDILQSAQPRVVLLDLLLPKVNGFQVLHFIRVSSPTLLAGVIVMTASSDPAFATHEALHGTRCFLRKPLDLDELTSHVVACAGNGAAGRRRAASSTS